MAEKPENYEESDKVKMSEKAEKLEKFEKGGKDDKDEVGIKEKFNDRLEKIGKFKTGVLNSIKTQFSNFLEFVSNLENFDEIEYPNIAFYKNEIPFYPSGITIEDILKTKNEDYRFLEETHTYIQWLFPNRDPGLNSYACILTDYEIKVISETSKLRKRVRRAFEMMLGFYGMRITEENRFELAENAQQRLHFLNRPFNHNYLRITRILLAIKELGHHELMQPWMKLLADLIYKDNLLNFAASSFENYWLKTLDAEEEMKLKSYVYELKNSKHPVVTRSMNPSTISTISTISTTTTTTNTIYGNSINDNMSATDPYNFNSTTRTSYTESVSQKNDNQDDTPSKVAADAHYLNHEYQHLSSHSMPLQSPTHIPHDEKMDNMDDTPSKVAAGIHYLNHEYQHLSSHSMPLQSPTHIPHDEKMDNMDDTPSKVAAGIHYLNHEYQHLSSHSMPLQSPTHIPHDEKMDNMDDTPSGTTQEKVTRSNSLKNLSSQ